MIDRRDGPDDVAALFWEAVDDFDKVASAMSQAEGNQFLRRGNPGEVAGQGITHLDHAGQVWVSPGQQVGPIFAGVIAPGNQQRDLKRIVNGHHSCSEEAGPLVAGCAFEMENLHPGIVEVSDFALSGEFNQVVTGGFEFLCASGHHFVLGGRWNRGAQHVQEKSLTVHGETQSISGQGQRGDGGFVVGVRPYPGGEGSGKDISAFIAAQLFLLEQGDFDRSLASKSAKVCRPLKLI